MKDVLNLFEQRYSQAIDFPVSAQPENWRTWDGELIEHNVSKGYAAANISAGQLFKFDDSRPSEGQVRHVGRITPDGIYVVMRDAQGLRAITSSGVMSKVMRDTDQIKDSDPIEYILTNL